MHYLAFACDNRRAQDWREAMLELLDKEAPARSAQRDRLIGAFNTGFRWHERRRTRCGSESEMQRRRLAEEGRALSEQLRREYLE